MTDDSRSRLALVNNNNPQKDRSSFLTSLRNFMRNMVNLGRNPASLEESVAELIEEHSAEGATILSSEEKAILQNVFRFGNIKASDIMIPRTDIIAVEKNISLDELKKIMIKHAHTRMPVYHDSLDNVIGFIHIKDLIPVLASAKPFIMDNIIRQLLVVSPSMKIIDLLAKMRHSRVHMALVLDEYGGTDGLVTIEDLVEEIVGEIRDEHDDSGEPDFVMLDENTMEASARLPIDKLEKALNITIAGEAVEDFDTVGGLILSLAGHVPAKHEKVNYLPENIEFEIVDSDPRRVKRVIIRKKTLITNQPEQESITAG